MVAALHRIGLTDGSETALPIRMLSADQLYALTLLEDLATLKQFVASHDVVSRDGSVSIKIPFIQVGLLICL